MLRFSLSFLRRAVALLLLSFLFQTVAVLYKTVAVACCLRMQRNFQRLLVTKPSLIQLFRATEAQAASEESVDAYGRAGQRAIHDFVMKFAKAWHGEKRGLKNFEEDGDNKN